MQRLLGKTAIITGAAQGMGSAHVRRFIAEGANVVFTDIQQEAGDKLAAELGQRALFVRQDVTCEEDWDAVVAAAEERFGGAQILVNNAALYSLQALEQETTENVRRLLEVNLFACWLGISKLTPLLRAAGSGSIINISSLAGMRGIPWHGIYGATKWGLRGMTRTAAYELGADNIRVNAVLPGAVENTGMFPGIDDEQRNLIPLQRTAQPDEISSLLVFLASDESAYITGADHVIDGGRGLW